MASCPRGVSATRTSSAGAAWRRHPIQVRTLACGAPFLDRPRTGGRPLRGVSFARATVGHGGGRRLCPTLGPRSLTGAVAGGSLDVDDVDDLGTGFGISIGVGVAVGPLLGRHG